MRESCIERKKSPEIHTRARYYGSDYARYSTFASMSTMASMAGTVWILNMSSIISAAHVMMKRHQRVVRFVSVEY